MPEGEKSSGEEGVLLLFSEPFKPAKGDKTKIRPAKRREGKNLRGRKYFKEFNWMVFLSLPSYPYECLKGSPRNLQIFYQLQ